MAEQSHPDTNISLWNPKAAALWSILLTPAFGAFLHAKNAKILGRKNEDKANMVWFYLSISYLVLIFAVEFFPTISYAIPEYVFQVITIAMLLGWYFNVGIKQARHVKDVYGNQYQRKSWLWPLLVAFGSVVVLFFAIFFYFLIFNNDDSETSVSLFLVPEDQASYAGSLSEIYIDGEINESILPKVKTIVEENKLQQAKVMFNSYGGDIGAATTLGEYIREKEFATEVGVINEKWGKSFAGECHSACTLAYIGGKYRYFDTVSKFGVHRFYSIDPEGNFLDAEAETQEFASLIIAYIRNMGVDISLFNKMAEQASEDVELLDIDEMRRMGIVNDGALASKWDFDIDEDGMALVGTQDKLDENGFTSIVCDGDSVLFYFGTEFNMDLKNAALRYSMLIDDEEINITDVIDGKKIDPDSGFMYISYKPTQNQILQILSANQIGLSHSSKDNLYSFKIDMDSPENKEKISDFIQYCKS